jgi:hypothetical protein
VQYTDQENDILLRSREIPAENVDDRNHPANYANIEPPKHPTVHAQMDMHKPS